MKSNNEKEFENENKDELSLMETNFDESIESFDELNLKQELLRGIYGYGFEKPSTIQQKAILPIIKGNDVIAQAQSGTGKTAAFAIGTLQLIDPEQNEIQCLVLSPTRELANQTSLVYTFLGEYMNIKTCLLIGGTRLESNIKELKKGPQILDF